MVDAVDRRAQRRSPAAHRLYAGDRADRSAPATLWNAIGATPMIGQNDVAGRDLHPRRGRALNAFADEQGLGRHVDVVAQPRPHLRRELPRRQRRLRHVQRRRPGRRTFATLLGAALTDRPDEVSADAVATASVRRRRRPTDDPDHQPVPDLGEDETYVERHTVVWHRNVYVAKWWTPGRHPDNRRRRTRRPGSWSARSCRARRRCRQPTSPADTYPEWDGRAVYTKGDRVLSDGVAFGRSGGHRATARANARPSLNRLRGKAD